MVTQIYGILNVKDAVASVEAGADNIGIVVGSTKDGVSVETAKEIFAAVGDSAVTVAILDIELDSEEAVLARARELGPDILHLSGHLTTSGEFYSKFREMLPGMKLMQAVAVAGPEAIAFAEAHMAHADYFILDSVAPSGGTGAAGVTHDWDIDREIIQRSSIPVIIAGGLGPDNVARAIQYLKPYGVDSLTKTCVFEGDQLIGKDLEKTRKFCEVAHREGELLGL